ncbi:5'-deoxynucleotidase YfbR [uncultured archaeon]|nr:5'-deoxynucleotidase YfbR [uncultured archaeon]
MKLSTDELDRITKFMLEAGKLKGIDRTGWVIHGVKRPEHVGDHSFSTALMSYIIALRMGLDAERCMAMALIHDIPEAKVGDIATRADEKNQTVNNFDKKALENKGMNEMKSLLDEESASRLCALWEELEMEKSQEARLVKQIDKLDYVLQLVAYSQELSDAAADEFLETAGKKITIPEVRYIYDKIKATLSDMRK